MKTDFNFKKIKNYIFDFGGVLYKIAPERTLDEFSNYSSYALSDKKIREIAVKAVIPYEKGKCDTASFHSMMCELLNTNLSLPKFKDIWNLTLKGIYPDSTEIVRRLSESARVVLLSNTNPLHYQYFQPECSRLFRLFERCYFSFRLGRVKPSIEIFDFVLSDMKIKAGETLFIDDTLSNIQTAKSLGINALHLTGHDYLSEIPDTVRKSTH